MRSRSRSDATHDKEPGESGPRPWKDRYRIIVMGAGGVGKTCIINRFLYESFITKYKATIEELHQGEYAVNGDTVTLDILDTTGSYAFPAMRKLSITTGDAFVLVYSLDDEDSFSEVKSLRQQIIDTKLADDKNAVLPPIVIVGNKLDLKGKRPDDEDEDGEERLLVEPNEEVKTLVSTEWKHGYVEASAKDDININGIFKELLAQAKVQLLSSPVIVRKRRQSFPASTLKNRRSEVCRVSWAPGQFQTKTASYKWCLLHLVMGKAMTIVFKMQNRL